MNALVIDDSRAMRSIIGGMLKGAGYSVTDAANGQEALEKLGPPGQIDVALVDWNMPVMNGFEFICAVRSDPRYANLRLMMVTTETETSQMMKALGAGVNEYVMKPFTKDVLIGKLDMLMATAGVT